MTDKIRVLFVLGSMAGGGSERQVIRLLRRLDRSKFQPLLYLTYRQGELLDEIPEDVATFSFWEVHEPPKWNIPGRIHRMQVRHLQRMIHDAAVDIVYDRTLVATLLAAPAARRARVPRVSTVVANPEMDVSRCAGRFASFKRRLLRRAYREAYRVVVVADDLRDAVIRYHDLPPSRVTTIRNPVDTKRIDHLLEQGDPGYSDDLFHVVAAGGLRKEKAFDLLIRALGVLVRDRGRDALRLHLVGQGDQEPSLRQIALHQNVQDHVCFEGYQGNPYPFIRAAQVFCLSSVFEGMPNVLLEAMACRTPVLATDCLSGPREVLKDGELGRLVPPGDVGALAAALEDAMDHYDRWRERVPAARRWVEQQYSVEAALSAIEDLLVEAYSHRQVAGQVTNSS